MNRREFLQVSGSAATGAALAETIVAAQVAKTPAPPQAASPRAARMKVGTQHGDSDAILRVLAGFGVNHICSRLPSPKMDEAWSVEGLTRFRTASCHSADAGHGAAAPQFE